MFLYCKRFYIRLYFFFLLILNKMYWYFTLLTKISQIVGITVITVIQFSGHNIHFPYYWLYNINNPCIFQFYHVTNITFITDFTHFALLVLPILQILPMSMTLLLLLLLSSYYWDCPYSTLTDVILYAKITFLSGIIFLIVIDMLWSSSYFFESSEKCHIAPYTKYHSHTW